MMDTMAKRKIAEAALAGAPWRVEKDGHTHTGKYERYFPTLIVVADLNKGGCHRGAVVINEAAPQTLEGCDATADHMAAFDPIEAIKLLDEIDRTQAQLEEARRFCADLVRQAALDEDQYGQAGAHESITKARVAQDLLALIGEKS